MTKRTNKKFGQTYKAQPIVLAKVEQVEESSIVLRAKAMDAFLRHWHGSGFQTPVDGSPREASQLSGSHGEWTNSDDVKGDKRKKQKIVNPYRLPQFNANVMVPYHLRFSNSGSVSTTITIVNLAQACGIMAATATTGYPIVASLKVNRVRIQTSSTTSNGTCSVQWQGNNTAYAPLQEISDSSVSTAQPAMVDCRPPRKSLAADWVNATQTGGLFYVSSTGGYTIMDVYLTAFLNDGSNNVGSVVTLVGATAGYMYYAACDGDGGSWAPVSKTVTT